VSERNGDEPGDPDPASAANVAGLMRLMGHLIHAAMPLPQHRF